MVKIDGRKLSHETLETIRILALRRVADGESVTDVMASYGFERTVYYKWKRAFDAGGEEALASRKGTGRPPKLSEEQREQVRRWITGKDPRQHGFDFGLWTRKIVVSLVQVRFGVSLGITSVGRLLASLGITPQKPLRRAYERDPVAIERWTREEFPAIKARARENGADIFFLDEAGIRSDPVLGKTWAPKGQTPVVPTSGQRQHINAISAVTASGAFWYDTYTGMFNAGRFVGFLGRFLRGRRRPVILVVDGHPAHKAKMVKKFIEAKRGRIELVFLPPYAPDLNPDEFVWNHVKKKGVSKTPLRRNESLRKRVEADLAKIKSAPSLVRAFFRAPSVSYVLD
jgi:transposase